MGGRQAGVFQHFYKLPQFASSAFLREQADRTGALWGLCFFRLNYTYGYADKRKRKMKKPLTISIAVLITLTAIAMTAAAALDRGGTALDKTLLVMMAIMTALLAHLLPALTKNKLAMVVWAGCLLATIYGHMTFFTNASVRAGESRAQSSLISTDITQQINAATKERDSIVTRPVTLLAHELAASERYRDRLMLKKEMGEAERRIEINKQIDTLQNELKKEHVTTGNDRVTMLISVVTQGNGAVITLALGMFMAILVEMSGAILWYEILNQTPEPKESQSAFATSEDARSIELRKGIGEEESDFERLKSAVDAGLCKPTVAAIRVYMGCRQDRAQALRRMLDTDTQQSPSSS